MIKIKPWGTVVSLTAISIGWELITLNQAQAHHNDIGWKSSLSNLGLDKPENLGQEFNFECLPAPARFSPGIWGTDNYSTSSYICPAAVHAGMITRDGGHVTVRLNPGQQLYASTERNGISSYNRAATDFSYGFVGEPVASQNNLAVNQPPETIYEIGWKSSVSSFGLAEYPNLNQQFTFKCTPAPAKFSSGIWGTDNYSPSSNICPAAVHAGMLTRDGGTVTIQLNTGQQLYASTERNGISSYNRGATEYSFFFVGDPVAGNNTQQPATLNQDSSSSSEDSNPIEDGARRGIERGVEDGVKDALRGLF
ncbi:MAG: LCCL domain-containing protein [Cyanobacteria bacterium P01_G01_bin.67]